MASLRISPWTSPLLANLLEITPIAKFMKIAAVACVWSDTQSDRRTWPPHKAFSLSVFYFTAARPISSVDVPLICTCRPSKPHSYLPVHLKAVGGWRSAPSCRCRGSWPHVQRTETRRPQQNWESARPSVLSCPCTAAYRKHFLFKYRRLAVREPGCSGFWPVTAHSLQCHSFELSGPYNTKDWNRVLNISMFIC